MNCIKGEKIAEDVFNFVPSLKKVRKFQSFNFFSTRQVEELWICSLNKQLDDIEYAFWDLATFNAVHFLVFFPFFQLNMAFRLP